MSNYDNIERLQYESWNGKHELILEAGYYPNHTMGLQLYEFTEDGWEPFDTLTKNIVDYPAQCPNAYVDTNSMSGALKMIKAFNLAVPTGRVASGTYCAYPEFKFDLDELRKYCINPEFLDELKAKVSA